MSNIIEHDGKSYPDLPFGTPVRVSFRSDPATLTKWGSEPWNYWVADEDDPTDYWVWNPSNPGKSDIIAYEVVE